MRIVPQSVELFHITPDAALAIERAARTCYKSEGLIKPGSADALIAKLITRKHFAMIEFADATVKFVCDRGVTHEMVRHRIASYAQESTRFCNYLKEKFGGEITVIQPPFSSEEDLADWELVMKTCEAAYLRMTGRGCRPELARSVLPNSLKTEIVMKANLREWLHFMHMRTAKVAHPQMREVACQAGQLLLKACPEVFKHQPPEPFELG